jgi:hypothetical protein
MADPKKAKIVNKDNGAEIAVLFNPAEYTIKKSVNWKEHRTPGLDSPEEQFTTGDPARLSLELFFDTYEDKKDVRQHTDQIAKLAIVDTEKHRPPVCLFVWGGFEFQGTLEEVTQRFTMFLAEGTPVRAVLNVTLKEYQSAEAQGNKRERNSPDHSKRRTVKQGETLNLIAAEEYDDPAEWRRIAEANGIADPMDVKPGTVLVLPPIL